MSKRFADLARAFIASLSRLRRGAFVTNESSKWCAAWATSSTARLNAASFACDGFVNPQSFRTNCSDDARISSFVAGGSKLCRVLMLRHMTDHRQLSMQEQLFRDADVFWFGEEFRLRQGYGVTGSAPGFTGLIERYKHSWPPL